jgi:hypothetical protein
VHRQIKQWLSAPARSEMRHMTRSRGRLPAYRL